MLTIFKNEGSLFVNDCLNPSDVGSYRAPFAPRNWDNRANVTVLKDKITHLSAANLTRYKVYRGFQKLNLTTQYSNSETKNGALNFLFINDQDPAGTNEVGYTGLCRVYYKDT